MMTIFKVSHHRAPPPCSKSTIETLEKTVTSH